MTLIEQTHLEDGSYERFLASIDAERLQDAQRRFWRLPLHELDVAEIEHSLFESLGGHNGLEPVLPHRIELFETGTKIFRGRAVDKSLTDIQQLSFCATAGGYYAPPAALSREGRLNSKGESVFYGSVQPYPIADELSIGVGDRLIIGAFETKCDLRFIQLVPNFIFDILDPTLRLIAKLQLGFIERLVTVPHGKSSSHAYRLAHHLTRSYFPLSHFHVDGWIFPSAFDPSQNNVAFPGQYGEDFLQLTHSGLFKFEATGLRLRSAIPYALFRYEPSKATGVQLLPEELAIPELIRVFGGQTGPLDPASTNDRK